MRRTLRTTTLATLMALAVLVLGATAALAQYPPAVDFGVTCTPQNPQPGQGVTCTVVGAVAGESLTASAEDNRGDFYDDSLTADDEGEASFGFDVPTDVQGNVIVRVVGAQSGEASTTLAVADEDVADPAEDVTPDDVEDERTLPVTGGQLAMLSLVGLGLVTTGGLAVRKRSATNA
jgi:hypothetical protein